MLPSCTYEFTSRNPFYPILLLLLLLSSSLFALRFSYEVVAFVFARWWGEGENLCKNSLGAPFLLLPVQKKKKNTDNRDYAELVACCLCSSSCCYWCNSCCCRGLMGYSAIRTAKWGRQGDIDASICEYIYYCSCVRWHIESD